MCAAGTLQALYPNGLKIPYEHVHFLPQRSLPYIHNMYAYKGSRQGFASFMPQ